MGFGVSHCRFARRACGRSTYCTEEPEARGRDCVGIKRVTCPLKRGAGSKRGLSTHCKVGGGLSANGEIRRGLVTFELRDWAKGRGGGENAYAPAGKLV